MSPKQGRRGTIEYATLASRVKCAAGKVALHRCEVQITRLYDAGAITAGELSRLDVKIMERLAKEPAADNQQEEAS